MAMAAVYNMPADPAAYMLPSVLNFPSGRKHYIIKLKGRLIGSTLVITSIPDEFVL